LKSRAELAAYFLEDMFKPETGNGDDAKSTFAPAVPAFESAAWPRL
jgi:hypothetical protein